LGEEPKAQFLIICFIFSYTNMLIHHILEWILSPNPP
jgi:hypothetical protein